MVNKGFYLKTLCIGTVVSGLLWCQIIWYSLKHMSLFGSSNTSEMESFLCFGVPMLVYLGLIILIWLRGRKKYSEWNFKNTLIHFAIGTLGAGTGLLFCYFLIWFREHL